jgi:hypothetical protein
MSYDFAVRSLYRKLHSFGNIKRVTPVVQASLHGHSVEMSRVEIESCRQLKRDIVYINNFWYISYRPEHCFGVFT